MFGVTPQVLGGAWADGPIPRGPCRLEGSQHAADRRTARCINATFARPQGAAARFNQHLCSPVVPVARKVDGHYEIVPTRVLTRTAGDILWQHGQEHGAISPRQFIKPGELLALENPDPAQPLQFIIHVLPAFHPQGAATTAAATAAPDEKIASQWFTAGNPASNPAGNPAVGGGLVENVLLLPAGAQAIRSDGADPRHARGRRPGACGHECGRPRARRDRTPPLVGPCPGYDAAARVGLWVTGDQSGALLLLELGDRDYVLPIDFSGRRYIEIPNGEVSWASSALGLAHGNQERRLRENPSRQDRLRRTSAPQASHGESRATCGAG